MAAFFFFSFTQQTDSLSVQLRTVKLLVFVNVGVIILLGCHAYTTSDLCLKMDIVAELTMLLL